MGSQLRHGLHILLFSGVALGLLASPQAAFAQVEEAFAQLLNPDISANLTLLGGYSTRPEDATGVHLRTGVAVQELELRLGASADPYFRLDVAIAGHADADELGVEFEEAYLSTTSLPYITLRMGKFRVNFSKANLQHVHAQRFIGAPAPLASIFGTDHLLGTGLSADVLLPLPFFMELNAQVVHAHWTGGGHAHGADGHDDDDADEDEEEGEEAHPFAYLLHLKTFFDLNDATTLELGASGLVNTDAHGHWQGAWGADMTLKWVPPEASRYTSVEWLTEYLSSHPEGGSQDGLYTGLRYQFAQQWWVQARGAVMDLASASGPSGYRAEALLAFAPSERTAIRLQYAMDHARGAHDEGHAGTPRAGIPETDRWGEPSAHEEVPAYETFHEVFLQFIVSIGPHPAHAY